VVLIARARGGGATVWGLCAAAVVGDVTKSSLQISMIFAIMIP